MLDHLAELFRSNGFMPHGHCYLWKPGLIWLHVGSDALIALSYYSIPWTLIYFVRKRRDLPFNWMFVMFGAFIVTCGTTHLLEIWTLWFPSYWLSGGVKLVTGFLSVVTAVLLVRLVPQALALPTPAALEIANRELDKANRIKSEFLATISHEIRTPMNGIFGMTELALDTQDDAERRDFLRRARACAVSMMTLVNDILDLSKIEAGKFELECIEFELCGVLDGVLDTLAIDAARKDVDLVKVVGDSLPARLRGDPGPITAEIILNLASNALKFTDHGEIVIQLERVDDDDGAVSADPIIVRCTVRDTGIGIPADQQQRIFESFEQGEHSTSRMYGGTGLGLAISQRLVTMMGGEIGVRSELGQGSAFWFIVPLGRADATRADPVADPIRSEATESALRRPA